MEIKITNEFRNAFSIMSESNATQFVSTSHKIIETMLALGKILVSEEDYEGTVEDGLDFAYHQLAVIEDDILSNIPDSELNMLLVLSQNGLLGNGLNSNRLELAYKKAIALVSMLDSAVEDYLPLDEEQITEFADLQESVLRNLIFPFLKELDVIDSIRWINVGNTTLHVNQYLHDYLTKRGYDIYEECVRLNNLIAQYPIMLETMEAVPEAWDDFISSVPNEYVGSLLDYASVVTVADIKSFNEGKLQIDDEYLNILDKRKLREGIESVEGEF